MTLRSSLLPGVVLVLAMSLGCGSGEAMNGESVDDTSASGEEMTRARAAHVHTWTWVNIMSITDTGSDVTHAVFGSQRCTGCGATRYTTVYYNHSYPSQPNWYSYNLYSSTQHEYKADYYCPVCGHTKHTRSLQNHWCESIYDSQCNACGYTNVRLCG